MHERKLLENIGKLRDNEHLGPYNVTILSNVTKSNEAEIFEVEIWKFFRKGYKLQWEQNGKPDLNRVSDLLFIGETRNSVSKLTSGYNNHSEGGMMTPEDVVRLIKFMIQHGILIDI
jgi:hypothetical protein